MNKDEKSLKATIWFMANSFGSQANVIVLDNLIGVLINDIFWLSTLIFYSFQNNLLIDCYNNGLSIRNK